MANYYRRTTCRLCFSDDLKEAVSLPPTVLGDHFTDDPEQDTEKFPIDLYFCSQCCHVQLVDVVDPKILFNEDFSYMPSKNEGLLNHFKEYAEFISRLVPNDIKCCIDIGSNDGLFLSVLKERYSCKVLGVDPAKSPADYANLHGIETWVSFLNPEISLKIIEKFGKVDLVSANNVFAHSDDLAGMANCISQILSDDGIFTFEFSYLSEIINKGLIGTVFHEHLSYHSLYSIIPFLRRAGLELIDVKKVDTQGGAAIGVAKKGKSITKSPIIDELLEEEKRLGVNSLDAIYKFRDKIHEDKNKLKSIIKNIPKNEKIIAFGASRSANLLIEFFELGEYIEYIVDDNKNKLNHFVPHYKIPIYSSEKIKTGNPKNVIILAWIHTEKLTRLIKNFDKDINVISLFPNISIH